MVSHSNKKYPRNEAIKRSSKSLRELRAAEQRLIDLCKRCDMSSPLTPEHQVVPFDTEIPRKVVPLRSHHDQLYGHNDAGEDGTYLIHALRVTNEHASSTFLSLPTKVAPLVMLHGYMGGAAMFARNFADLTRTFPCIYSLDMLGWGLSSRPKFDFVEGQDPIEATEAFFVESLEAWRKENKIEKMVLAGYCLGGYLSVAYCGKSYERRMTMTSLHQYMLRFCRFSHVFMVLLRVQNGIRSTWIA